MSDAKEKRSSKRCKGGVTERGRELKVTVRPECFGVYVGARLGLVAGLIDKLNAHCPP